MSRRARTYQAATSAKRLSLAHVPIDIDDIEDNWPDDEDCERCRDDGHNPMTDYLLPCPACQGGQH